MRFFAILAVAVLACPAAASPPPPPPPYVSQAATILAGNTVDAASDGYAALFANDVVVDLNGNAIAAGKAASLQLIQSRLSKFHRRIDGYTLASMPEPGSSGELLVIDEVDPVAPADMVADARWTTRATLYQFGSEGHIHHVRIVEAAGFLQVPPVR